MGTPVTSRNRGVLALGASLINLCSEADEGALPTLLLGNRDSQPVSFRVNGQHRLISVVHSRLAPRSHPRHHLIAIVLMAILYRLLPFRAVRAGIAARIPWIGSIAGARFVGDVRGGDSFSDIYGMRRFLLGFLTSLTVILVRGSIVHFPQTYGPYKSPMARFLARFLLRRSSVVVARDAQSQHVAQALLGPNRQVLLCPDVAFTLDAIPPRSVQLDPPLEEAGSTGGQGPSGTAVGVPPGVIGLNVNGLMFNGGYTRQNMFNLRLDYAAFVGSLIEALLAEHPGELWLIPHTYAPPGHVESDNDAAEQVRRSLPPNLQRRVRVLTSENDQHELKWIIGRTDFFVGSRMHSCIAALSQGVPCVGVAYSMKFAGVFESVGMRDWVIEGGTTSNAEAVRRIVELYRQRETVRDALRLRADAARDSVRQTFAQVVKEAAQSRPKLVAR